MKFRTLFIMVMTGLATCAFGQQILLDNLNNTGDLWATSGGLVYEPQRSDPSTNSPWVLVPFDGENYNLGVSVLGGSSLGSLALMGTYTPLTDPKGYTGIGPGLFQLGPAGVPVTVQGVAPGGLAWIELQIWDYDSPETTGTFSSYAAAIAGLDPGIGMVIFQTPTSNPNPVSGPPVPAPDLVGMPSVVMVLIPEPATLALTGLGFTALLAVRRK